MHRTLRIVLVLASLLLLAPAAHAASPNLVISQVYAAGGNAGASYSNDFVELFNRGTSSIDLGGWTIQYAASSSTSWQSTPLSGSLAAGRHYLVQLASAAAIGASLPAPDATGSTNLAVSGGKVALVHDTAALNCGATAGSCSAVPLVVDLLGYGPATDYEGSGPAAVLTATTAALRGGSGCADTDSNPADFTTATPAPLTTAAAVAACSVAPAPGPTVGQDAAVDIQIEPVISIALEHPTLSFGRAVAGQTPTSLSEHVTVVSNNAGGYSLTAHRTAFAPADLPLGIAVGGGALAPLPVAPALDLLVGSSSARSVDGGDVWATSLGFPSLPTVAPGLYASTVTFTVIGR